MYCCNINISSRFYRNSGANASELLENPEELLLMVGCTPYEQMVAWDL